MLPKYLLNECKKSQPLVLALQQDEKVLDRSDFFRFPAEQWAAITSTPPVMVSKVWLQERTETRREEKAVSREMVVIIIVIIAPSLFFHFTLGMHP